MSLRASNRLTASSHKYFPDVTGGVYKAPKHSPQRADLRLLRIPPSSRSGCRLEFELRLFLRISSSLRFRHLLKQPLSHMNSPAYKGHEDLTWSPTLCSKSSPYRGEISSNLRNPDEGRFAKKGRGLRPLHVSDTSHDTG